MNPHIEISGHWYCSFCNDVVNIRKPVGRWDEKRGQLCPVCHNRSADWIDSTAKPAKPASVSPERGAELFGELKQNVPYPR